MFSRSEWNVNQRAIPTPQGGRRWHAQTVANIAQRESRVGAGAADFPHGPQPREYGRARRCRGRAAARRPPLVGLGVGGG